MQDKDLKKILPRHRRPRHGSDPRRIIELLFKRGFLSKRGAISTLRRPAGAHSFPAGDGRATGHDRPLGVGVDADQRETVPLSGLMQPLVGTLYQLIDQARSTPVRQFRGPWRRAGRRSRSAKVKEAERQKAADDTAPPPQ
ncbi:hypothetical protein J4734_25460 [Klebsiella pneumoniae]|uniref:Uncharacterized protein n=1 Tax=Klebsiella pneumoniae TaxID=573 RepID=A0A939SQF8_KLEPN|nr:hypothetical protein [Klebsiella pneumoniae]